MKHRSTGSLSKLKYEHHMADGLRPVLERLTTKPFIKSILPGKISRHNLGEAKPHLKLQYETSTGVKCLWKGHGAIQEVFIVGVTAELVRELRHKK